MSSLLIEGGHRLEGRVSVEGNKNAALPLLAACLLTDQECVLTNVPRIGDVEVMARLLLDIGAEVEGIGTTTLRVRTPSIRTHVPDRSLVGRLRGSVLLLGPLLARTGRAHIAPPGGDFPARRTISTHIEALLAMGAHDDGGPDHALHAPDGLKSASMYLEEASVTGTETVLLAAASAVGLTEIRNAATEPHYIEAGSWAVVAAITGGEIAIEGARDEDIEVVASVLKRMNVECGMRDGVFTVKPSKPRAVRRITTGLWPAFPSDLVSLVTVLATQSVGRTLVHDWMYELRLFALEQMSGMGADMFLADAHRIIVTGPTRLRGGRILDSRDLRSGMSLIAAGLAAEGQTRVAPLETVERGYSNVVQRLVSLGAQVAKVE
jgi:UDP-N-acetylglucosamine 1-carboxyvinyltransferase